MFKEINLTFKNLSKTFYLYENQGWEKSFIYNLKKNNLNKIYAVQNSTVRFWDLRFSVNNYKISNLVNQLEPNFYLVNGNDSFEKEGRHFQNFTESSLLQVLSKLPNTKLIKLWKTTDKRDGREKEFWINAIIRIHLFR